MDGVLYFVADDGTHGDELWRSDGTAGGTYLLKDTWEGAGDGNIADLAAVDGTLFFRADDGVNGGELWRSDGTAGGTYMVTDLYDGGDASPHSLTAMNGVLYFAADDGVHGRELWKSDGKHLGNEPTYTLVSGAGDVDNASFTIEGDWLKTNEVFDYDAKSSYSIRVRVDDGDGGTYEEVFTITVLPENQAPVLEDLDPDRSLGTIDEESSLIIDVADFAGQITDGNADAVKGIAISGTVGNGIWEYNLNDGNGWHEIGSVSDTYALLLSAEGGG